MKIAEVIVKFPPYHGGMGYVCYYNSNELARLGHDVTVFTLDYGKRSFNTDPNSFKVVRLKTPIRYGDAGMIPQLYKKLKDFDVIHLHYPFFGGAEYVYLSSVSRGQRYFITYHMDVFGDTLLKKMIIDLYEPFLMKKIIKRASLIGALNKEHLINSKAARFVDWSKVIEMPNGVDVGTFKPREKNKELLEKYDLKNKIIVLFVGNLLAVKGLHLLIEAISKINDINVVLLIVGSGYNESGYKTLVTKKQLSNRVIFAGPKLHHEELPKYYNLCDFLVLPSTHSESFGLVLLEAMASEKPVIVSSLPGPSQVIEDGKEGLIARVGDAEDLKNKIEYLAGDEGMRQAMGRKAREKALNKYRWEHIGAQLEKILISIVNN